MPIASSLIVGCRRDCRDYLELIVFVVGGGGGSGCRCPSIVVVVAVAIVVAVTVVGAVVVVLTRRRPFIFLVVSFFSLLAVTRRCLLRVVDVVSVLGSPSL